MAETPRQFIEEKGIAEVAKATGRTEGAVRVWKHRNRFPREAWLELNAAFPELTLDVLRDLAGSEAA
jgi:hypothetical protein